MLKIEYTQTYGWEAAIRGMRNPMNSWSRSDSHYHYDIKTEDTVFEVGENDQQLMQKLAAGGSTHAKYRRMINVTVDITAPLYWWKEFDTYKVGTVVNSCSTMHKIHSKEFTPDDFSHEHILVPTIYSEVLMLTIQALNVARSDYLETKDKKYWWQMIQLLPTSYNQKRTVQLNYEVLARIFKDRKNHKLDEWHILCDWIRGLPYSEIITGDI